ncbi:hypothetical protein BX285_0993 [Streptomyces sp. 1114.5]|uniref:hypothetical protein n=1 Tax=unclassified Streptomyces TaxID=2593676 RepID=UPI000BC8A310|nr:MULTISPECIES: hypothetical protein [unclassified Streptomyces]RKT16647.1 hypothetical protein BX285_0993 [Streptomyces sp. 1114.5]SOB82818.1 hypothetical protein SAMN06272789_3001 [Streptomyces sp. 1331.2]
MNTAPSATGDIPPHVRELAGFLDVLGRGDGPGILWPEEERPADGRPDAVAALTAEARALERLTGTPVTIETHRADEGGNRPMSAGSAGRLLVRHTAGAGSWTLLTGTGRAAQDSFRCRLRSDEVLYVPPGWRWHAHLTPHARLTLTRLGPPAAHR